MRLKADLNEAQRRIMLTVQAQMKRKMDLKTGHRKKVKTILERLSRRIARGLMPTDIRIRPYDSNSSLGSDELGRDVEDAVRKYVEILKGRGVNIQTVIALGSRVKGSWKPESDVDVTIVANNLPDEGNNPISRRMRDLKIRLLLSDSAILLGIEPSGCCSPSQFLERLEHFDIQELDAVLYGKVIYDVGFWQTAMERYHTLEKKYRLDTMNLKIILKDA